MTVLNLFKFYQPKYEGKDNLSFYSHKAIYFQQPRKFNDPWDCKAPQIIIPRQINTLRDIWFHLVKKDHSIAETEWNKIRELPRSEIKQNFEKIYKDSFEQQRAEIGVFSLSFIPDSELMWSHYADSHSGYMLHFQIDTDQYFINPNLSKIGIPVPVIYSENRQALNLIDYFKFKEKHLYDIIRYKSSAWQYECELRLFNPEENGFIRYSSNWLKSIVIGINSEKVLQEKLNCIGKELAVPVFSSVMNKSKYKIDIPGFEMDGVNGKAQYKKVIDSGEFELMS